MKTKIKHSKDIWEYFSKKDIFWSILTNPSKLNNKWKIDEFYRTGEEVYNSISHYLNQFDKNKDIALDYGCGVGRITQFIEKRFKLTIGIDISKNSLVMANSFLKNPRINFLLNINEKLEHIKSNSINFIFCYLTIQHLPTQIQKSLCLEFIRILKPNGILILQAPSKPTLTSKGIAFFFFRNMTLRMKNFFVYRYKYYIPLYCFSRKNVFALLNGNNLKIIEVIRDNACGRNFISYKYVIKKI